MANRQVYEALTRPERRGERRLRSKWTLPARSSIAPRGWASTISRSGCGSSIQWSRMRMRRRLRSEPRTRVPEFYFKMRDDPRITKVEAFICRFSIDELPHPFNVLGGPMSLVGPRPPLPDEAEKYDGRVARRMLVRSGMTGLWQVSGRSDLSWEESVRLDFSNVEN